MKIFLFLLVLIPSLSFGQITLQNSGNDINVIRNANIIQGFHKSGLEYSYSNITVYLKSQGNVYSYRYADIDVPVTANIGALMDTLSSWIGANEVISITDADGRMAEIDASTHAQIVITHPHHEIHEGNMFNIDINDPDLDTGDTISVSFRTPNTTRLIHMLASVDNTSLSEFSILENPTIKLDSGTEITVLNKRRDSSTQSTVLSIETVPNADQVTVDAYITAEGTTLDMSSIGAGNNKLSGERRDAAEWILAPNTVYSFRLVGKAENGSANMHLIFYEYVDKEVID